MYIVSALTSESLPAYAGLYDVFSQTAQQNYAWDHQPLPLSVLGDLLANHYLHGYGLVEMATQEPAGLMLYRQEPHRSLEINVIIQSDAARQNNKVFLDVLMRKFLSDCRQLPQWDVISYAMLGQQSDLINTMTWYGFKPVGQAIVNFNMLDPIHVQILKTRQYPPMPDGLTLTTFAEQAAVQADFPGVPFLKGLVDTVYEAFHTSTDALWDPRFRTREGVKNVLQSVLQGEMGDFVPEATSLILNQDQTPVALCLMIQPEMLKGNIPIVAIQNAYRGKYLSKPLLQKAIESAIDGMLNATVAISSIHATLDTDNIAAIQMYRSVGFTETSHYPHVYLPRASFQPDYREPDATTSETQHPSLWVSQQLNPAYHHPATRF
ncbi:MAG: hypothetical protein VKK59_02535 [Vampirovibrionales bacterium]|nr:hypothetical protein [Vampirovibrionales bacterium]